MTTDNDENDTSKKWADAAEATKPLPRRFTEKLPCRLSPAEHHELGLKYRDAVKARHRYEEESKQIAAARKAEATKLQAVETGLGADFDSGRVERDVEVEEHTSLSVLKKWKVRLDTDEMYDERPLTASERQALLPGFDRRPVSLEAERQKRKKPKLVEVEPLVSTSTAPTEAPPAAAPAQADPAPANTDPEALLREAKGEPPAAIEAPSE